MYYYNIKILYFLSNTSWLYALLPFTFLNAKLYYLWKNNLPFAFTAFNIVFWYITRAVQ